MTRRIWPEITSTQRGASLPDLLPLYITKFLASVLQLDQDVIQLCWIAFHDFIERADLEILAADDDMFHLHGLENNIGSIFYAGAAPIFAPYKQCPRLGCANAPLECLTRYYHNYSVQNASAPDSERVYYEQTSNMLHVFEHSFVERELCHLFEAEMAVAQQEQLVLPHGGLQKLRFICAMDDRNYFMAGTGQEMWAHACDNCMKKWITPDGIVSQTTYLLGLPMVLPLAILAATYTTAKPACKALKIAFAMGILTRS
ncbi:hypothetical protein B0H17DRAFT_1135801 [Mycena rosella]|uniref:CxC5 like cysteine cluster associated with KDZ domain-containing protein n=1 Tax=Mycena rosella TaxID=1033263 RepID=A0AAD7DC25_MYCRO|nr:hypothetical protein B0H17DRAFT_1135801 [Mycena rosella]